jgi:hypothetical protein
LPLPVAVSAMAAHAIWKGSISFGLVIQVFSATQNEDYTSFSQLRCLESWGTLNVLGQPAEPICTYYRCQHRFSLHGSRRCRANKQGVRDTSKIPLKKTNDQND